MDQDDRLRRTAAKSRLSRRADRLGRSQDAGIDQHPSRVARRTSKDHIDDRRLAVRDLARVGVAPFVSLRMFGTCALGGGFWFMRITGF